MKTLLFLFLALNFTLSNAYTNDKRVVVNYDYNEREYMLVQSISGDKFYATSKITIDGKHDIDATILTRPEYNALKNELINQ